MTFRIHILQHHPSRIQSPWFSLNPTVRLSELRESQIGSLSRELSGYYVTLEEFYMEETVKKAISINKQVCLGIHALGRGSGVGGGWLLDFWRLGDFYGGRRFLHRPQERHACHLFAQCPLRLCRDVFDEQPLDEGLLRRAAEIEQQRTDLLPPRHPFRSRGQPHNAHRTQNGIRDRRQERKCSRSVCF